MLVEEVLPNGIPMKTAGLQASHPLNSSRLLLDLMSFADSGKSASGWDAFIHRSALRRLMLAMQYREPGIVNHSRRVATLGVAIGQYLGWDGPNLQALEAACLLHDIGKIGVPDMILQKPGRLTPDESELMTLIDHIATDVLQACHAQEDVIQIVQQMPLHFNGACQGFRLVGSEVHLGARILAAVDAYDSLVTPQVFRDRFSHNEAMDILHRAAGSQFDGNVLSAMTRWFEFNGVPEALYATQMVYTLSPEEVLEAGSICHVFSYLYLLESLFDGFYITDPEGRIVVWNGGMESITGTSWRKARSGYVPQYVHYQTKFDQPLAPGAYPVADVVRSGRVQTVEVKIKDATGAWLLVEVQTMPLIDQGGQVHGYAEILRDLSGKKTKTGDRDLRLMASRDALTHVANRGELKSKLELLLQEYQRSGFEKSFSVIFMDVDHFKRANDTYGHAAGDEVLVSIARLLQHETYSGELVARYGGEEFVVLCPDTELEEAFKRAERLRLAIKDARVVQTDEFRVAASFGVSTIEPDDTIDTVVQRADKALYMSKRQGRNRTNRLTSELLRLADPNMVEPPIAAVDAWQHEAKLRACMAANMVVYKLKALVDEHAARLLEVTPTKLRMQMGQRGILPFWGGNAERQPVEVALEFGDERSAVARGASKLSEITVKITPRGWATNVDLFQTRAKSVVKLIREYLSAEFANE